MMAQGVQRMDQVFANALAAGAMPRDPSLNQPPPPPMPELPVEEKPVAKPVATTNNFQVQVVGTDVNTYNFAMAHLRTLGGVVSATPQQINATGTSYILVSFRGSASQLAAALSARGWTAEASGTVVRIRSATGKPPALPAPPPAAPAPQPAQPAQQQPAQPQPVANQTAG
jgi:hypothetical protein